MKKRKHKKRKSRHFLGLTKTLTFIILSFALIVFVATIIIIAYNLGFEEAQEKQSVLVHKAHEKNKLLRDRLQKTLEDNQESASPRPVKEANYTADRLQDRMKDIKKAETPLLAEKSQKLQSPPLKDRSKKPKLAIILDDVSFASEVRDVKALGLKVNFSFFPVSRRHPLTARLASREPFYMVHLPLEAMSFNSEEAKTLRVDDSMATMEQRFSDIKKDFPRLRYVNNHTGSKFTSDYDAVMRLYKAARLHKLDIVDSRTIASTKLPEVYSSFNRKLLSRDVFLDHESDVDYICGQMRLAVDTAISNGKAIAIGHPRKHTIQALKQCKSCFSKVDLVYITEL